MRVFVLTSTSDKDWLVSTSVCATFEGIVSRFHDYTVEKEHPAESIAVGLLEDGYYFHNKVNDKGVKHSTYISIEEI